MTSISADKRARLAELRREIEEILDPSKVEAARRRREYRAAMVKRVGKRGKGQREPRERDPGFLAFVRRQPCAARHTGGCGGPIHAAHIRFADARKGRGNPGMGTKNHDRFCTPICEAHHMRDQHAGAERAFWQRVGLDAYDIAAALYEQYTGAAPGGSDQ